MREIKMLFKTPRFVLGLSILLLLLAFVVVMPMINTGDPFKMIGASYAKPGTVARSGKVLLLGADNFGRDILLELAYAVKVSMMVGVIGGSVATVLGLSIGMFSGYKGGLVDNLLGSVTNMLVVIPSFIILILISVSLGSRSVVTLSLIIGCTCWPSMAKAVRGQTISLRDREHVNIARITGYSTTRIILTEILPYLASYAVTTFILHISISIMQEASLSMLGLGPQNTVSLGVMLNWAILYVAPASGAWWAFIPPTLAITLIAFSMYMMNSGMDEIFNPKIRR